MTMTYLHGERKALLGCGAPPQARVARLDASWCSSQHDIHDFSKRNAALLAFFVFFRPRFARNDAFFFAISILVSTAVTNASSASATCRRGGRRRNPLSYKVRND